MNLTRVRGFGASKNCRYVRGPPGATWASMGHTKGHNRIGRRPVPSIQPEGQTTMTPDERKQVLAQTIAIVLKEKRYLLTVDAYGNTTTRKL